MVDENYSRVIKHKLYWEIIKGRRTSKGNRWLSHCWPNISESKKAFRPNFAYLNHIGPGDTAGNHYHRDKKEFFCPMGELLLLLRDVKGKKTVKVKMSLGPKDFYKIYYIPPLVPHAIKNNTKKFQPLLVLTNKQDIYGKTYEFII
ncbi:MAG: cupin domain-containing protein [Patescibacteria group bacterium]|jgi:oxalate decarboxylase/phosphoglucose isomerase-like protein (cupin superfamily)